MEADLAMGRIEVRVTDAPPREEITSILVTVAENSVEVHKAVAEQVCEHLNACAKAGERDDNELQECFYGDYTVEKVAPVQVCVYVAPTGRSPSNDTSCSK